MKRTGPSVISCAFCYIFPAVNKALLFVVILLLPIPTFSQNSITKEMQAGLSLVTTENLFRHVERLASDEFEGRFPGTRGEELSVKYLVENFRKTGAVAGNPNGTFLQNVPLVGFTSKPSIGLSVSGKSIPFAFQDDFVHDYPRLSPNVDVRGTDVVFAGYGITAPQYGWDDYKDVEVRGKLLLVLSGEPSRASSADGKTLDADFFKGEVRTYYSTREFKYEEARKRGAAGILIIYDPKAANTYSLFQTFAAKEGLNLRRKAGEHELAIAGLMTTDAAQRIFAAVGKDFPSAQRSAADSKFRARTLGVKADVSIRTRLRSVISKNVIAKVAGSDPKLRNEYVIFTAHWDHLGKDTSLTGDQIYNGANDNAIGVAQLIEAARAFAAMKQKPKRSILFIATTAEEAGYFGARYYLKHPLYPLSKTIANINLDAGNMFGLTSDLGSTGYGNSTLDEILLKAAEMQGRRFVTGSLDTTGGMYFASDQIEFAKAGIPAVFPWSGLDYVDKPNGYADKAWDEYSQNRYHKVADEVMPDWDFAGAVEDTRWFVIAGNLVANDPVRPKFKKGSEFQLLSKKPRR